MKWSFSSFDCLADSFLFPGGSCQSNMGTKVDEIRSFLKSFLNSFWRSDQLFIKPKDVLYLFSTTLLEGATRFCSWATRPTQFWKVFNWKSAEDTTVSGGKQKLWEMMSLKDGVDDNDLNDKLSLIMMIDDDRRSSMSTPITSKMPTGFSKQTMTLMLSWKISGKGNWFEICILLLGCICFGNWLTLNLYHIWNC